MSEVCAPERTGEAGLAPARKYRVAPISIAQAIEAGAAAMFVHHWEEVEFEQEGLELDIDWPRMFDLERLGYSRSFGLWCEDKLVGYSLFHVTPHIHSRQVLQAVNDVLFVEKDHRGIAGVLLVRAAEKMLADSGAKHIVYASKVDAKVGRRGNTTGDLLERMGYRLDELIYTKLLGGE